MENASKALLIAGSILIAILLIAVGMKVFNSTGETSTQVEVTMDTSAVAQFNSKFTQYVGVKNRAQVISLLNTAIASNATNTGHTVTVNSVDPKTLINSVADGQHTISIDSTDYDANGYITNIKFN